MIGDKSRAQAVSHQLLSAQDQLIQQLADEAADPDQDFKAASQWPGRTMLAVKRDVFPLPHAAPDGQTLLANITGITHLIFDHQDPDLAALGRNIAELTGVTETLALEEGGVIVRVRKPTLQDPADEASAAPAEASEESAPSADENAPR